MGDDMLVAVAAPAALSYSHGHVHDPRHAGLREVGGAVVAAPSTTPSKSAHMSGATEAAIRLLPGNDVRSVVCSLYLSIYDAGLMLMV
jgi:hypothetical protein